ncbi:MAG TPA: hypothetical protein VK821_09470 [Dehalococcoidia bacterium]|nr:hypothetical protein [Dehalococcoidia bacterium]
MVDLEASHQALIDRTGAGEPERSGFRAIYDAIAAGLGGVSEAELQRAPSPEEWSMAEVVEHVAEHDRKYIELAGQGLRHYLEHGLEHAIQLWHLRPRSP